MPGPGTSTAKGYYGKKRMGAKTKKTPTTHKFKPATR